MSNCDNILSFLSRKILGIIGIKSQCYELKGLKLIIMSPSCVRYLHPNLNSID